MEKTSIFKKFENACRHMYDKTSRHGDQQDTRDDHLLLLSGRFDPHWVGKCLTYK